MIININDAQGAAMRRAGGDGVSMEKGESGEWRRSLWMAVGEHRIMGYFNIFDQIINWYLYKDEIDC